MRPLWHFFPMTHECALGPYILRAQEQSGPLAGLACPKDRPLHCSWECLEQTGIVSAFSVPGGHDDVTVVSIPRDHEIVPAIEPRSAIGLLAVA